MSYIRQSEAGVLLNIIAKQFETIAPPVLHRVYKKKVDPFKFKY